MYKITIKTINGEIRRFDMVCFRFSEDWLEIFRPDVDMEVDIKVSEIRELRIERII